MALVKREDISHAMAPCEHDDRLISEADPEIGVALNDGVRTGNVPGLYRLEHISTTLDLFEQACSCGETNT